MNTFHTFHKLSDFFQLKAMDELIHEIPSPAHFLKRVKLYRVASVSNHKRIHHETFCQTIFTFRLASTFFFDNFLFVIACIQSFLYFCLPPLYNTWTHSPNLGATFQLFQPFLEKIMHTRSATLKTLMDNMESLCMALLPRALPQHYSRSLNKGLWSDSIKLN